LWLLGAFMLFRQIRMEMALDRMTSQLETMARDLEAEAADDGFADIDAPPERRVKSAAEAAEAAEEAWIDRDDAARRGWIAGQAVLLTATSLAMLMMHAVAAWLVAGLVIGQGVYFFWRERTARRAPSAEAADHARPSKSTVNAGWVSLVVAMLVWAAAFRGLLN
jgi:hypothetical protein